MPYPSGQKRRDLGEREPAVQGQIAAVADEPSYLPHARVHVAQRHKKPLRCLRVRIREQAGRVDDRRHADGDDRHAERPAGKLLPAVADTGAGHDTAVRQLDGPEKTSRLRRGQCVDDDDGVRLRRLHGALHKLQTFDARLPQNTRLTGGHAGQPRDRLQNTVPQVPRHDHVPHGLRPDGVGRNVPVAKPHNKRLPARPQ